jgi:2-dehydropantoate 2-reductase
MSRKIAVLGAGSIGCFIGGLWQAAGFDVILIGRDAVAAEVARSGMRLTDHAGLDLRLEPKSIRFSVSPGALAEADLILLTVKSTGTEAAAQDIARHASGRAAVLSLQNGISNVEMLETTLPDRKILRGSVGFNVAWQGGGHWHRGTSGLLAAQKDPDLEPIAAKLATSPGELALVDDALSLAWGKLLLNLNNAVNALSGKTLLSQLSERPYRRVLAASMREALTILSAAGITPAKIGPLPPAFIPAFVAAPDFVFNAFGLKLQKIDARARSSMADDFAAGRTTEIDFLNGEIVRLARKLGRPAPVNEKLVALVKEAEKGGRRDWPGEVLEAAARG